MDEQQAVTPVRTRRRPSRAGRGHRAALEGLTLALVFSLGLLAGVGLSYGAWIWPGQQEEAPIAAASPDPSPPTELVVSETAPPTQPATEPSTQPMTEATEPETEPPTQPPTEPQEEPAAVTEPPAPHRTAGPGAGFCSHRIHPAQQQHRVPHLGGLCLPLPLGAGTGPKRNFRPPWPSVSKSGHSSLFQQLQLV